MTARLLRRRVPCVTWPCKRCDAAGRTGWRAREAWHQQRRDRWLGIAGLAVGAAVVLLLNAAVLAEAG